MRTGIGPARQSFALQFCSNPNQYVGHDHLHHRMARVLGGRTQSVLFIYLLTFCLGLNAILLRDSHHPLEAFLLLCQALLIVFLVSVLEADNGKQRG